MWEGRAAARPPIRSQQVATLSRWGERTRLRALRVAFGNVPSEASPLRCMSSASRMVGAAFHRRPPRPRLTGKATRLESVGGMWYHIAVLRRRQGGMHPMDSKGNSCDMTKISRRGFIGGAVTLGASAALDAAEPASANPFRAEDYAALRKELRAFYPDECHGKCKHPAFDASDRAIRRTRHAPRILPRDAEAFPSSRGTG